MNFKKFKNFFQNLQNKNVYVGFSGGADSRFIIEVAKYFQMPLIKNGVCMRSVFSF